MELTKDDKDELRELVQEEIYKAFEAAFAAALNAPTTNLGEALSTEYREQREQRNKIIREIGNSIKAAMQTIKAEAQARIVEKTDPERAERIRALAVTTF